MVWIKWAGPDKLDYRVEGMGDADWVTQLRELSKKEQ
jgi:hypothetical protein